MICIISDMLAGLHQYYSYVESCRTSRNGRGYDLDDLKTYRPTDLQTYRSTDLQIFRSTDLQAYRLTDLQIDRPTDLQAYRLTVDRDPSVV